MKAIVLFRGQPFASTEVNLPPNDLEPEEADDLVKRYVMAMFLGDKSGVEKITELYSFSEGTSAAIEGRPFNVTIEALKAWVYSAFSVVLDKETAPLPENES